MKYSQLLYLGELYFTLHVFSTSWCVVRLLFRLSCYFTFIAILCFCISHQLLAKQCQSDPTSCVQAYSSDSLEQILHSRFEIQFAWHQLILLPGVAHLPWFHPCFFSCLLAWRNPPIFSVQIEQASSQLCLHFWKDRYCGDWKSDSVLLLSTRGCIDKTGWEQDGANWKLRHCSRRKLNFAENWDAPSDSSVCGYQPRHVRRLLLLPPPLHLPLLPLHPHHIIQLDATSQVSVLNLSNYPELPSKHLKRRSGLPACDSVSTTFWTENGNRERRPFRTRRTIGTTQLVCQKSIWLRWDSHMQAWECWSIRKFANQATGKCWFFYTANS